MNSEFDAFAILDMLPVGVVVHAPDTRVLHANKKALAVRVRVRPVAHTKRVVAVRMAPWCVATNTA